MIGQRHCPFCGTAALKGCQHLALAVEGRDFVRRCVELSQTQTQWQALCEKRRRKLQRAGEWAPEREDFTWLETAFSNEFLKPLRWFHALDYEWRSGPKPGQGGFWVLVWSKDSRRLWWELRDALDREWAQLSAPLEGLMSPAQPARAAGTDTLSTRISPTQQEPWLLFQRREEPLNPDQN